MRIFLIIYILKNIDVIVKVAKVRPDYCDISVCTSWIWTPCACIYIYIFIIRWNNESSGFIFFKGFKGLQPSYLIYFDISNCNECVIVVTVFLLIMHRTEFHSRIKNKQINTVEVLQILWKKKKYIYTGCS